jgi:glycosyltransferase involved in cell wall biosynthesis
VVAVAAQGPAALITHGVDGFLTPPELPEALAQDIGTLLADPGLAAALGAGGRAAWEAGYAPVPVVAQWRGFLRHVAKESR